MSNQGCGYLCRQIPVGVLYDLLASENEQPWRLTVRSSYPSLMPWMLVRRS